MKTLNDPKTNNLSFEKEPEEKDFHFCQSSLHTQDRDVTPSTRSRSTINFTPSYEYSLAQAVVIQFTMISIELA